MEDMTEAEVLKYVITKQFNKTEDEIGQLLYEGDQLKPDAGDVILTWNEEKIKKLKADRDDNFNKGFQKAEKEVKTKVEKTFKELTGFTSDAEDFETLVKSYVEESATKTKTKPLTDDEIKKHPLFIQLEQSRVPKEDYERIMAEYNDYKNNVARNQVLETIKGKAWDIVSAKNPILPASPQIANTLREKFLEEFTQFDYEQQNGSIIVSKQGKRVEDQHGNLRAFDSLVAEVAGNFFEFQAQSDKGNAGNGGGQTVVTSMPKTSAELSKIFAVHNSNSKEDKEIRMAAAKYYQANKAD